VRRSPEKSCIFICDECVALCAQINAEAVGNAEEAHTSEASHSSPASLLCCTALGRWRRVDASLSISFARVPSWGSVV